MSDPQVLVVEDEPLICGLLLDALEDEGVRATAAADPPSAFAALETAGDGLRVLVTDINLGGSISGFEVARRARRLLPELFVIYVTGHAEADIGAQGVPGAMMLPKPYLPSEVAERIAALVKVASSY